MVPRCLITEVSPSGFQRRRRRSLGLGTLPPFAPAAIRSTDQLANASFLAWTTTPGRLPANAGAGGQTGRALRTGRLHPRRDALRGLVLAHALANGCLATENWTVLARFQGDDVRGVHYQALFDGVPAPNQKVDWEQTYRVVTDDFVSLEDGTGIVHIAPAYGDLEIGRKYGLPTLFSVDLAGMTLPAFTRLGKGSMFFKQADPLHHAQSQGAWTALPQWTYSAQLSLLLALQDAAAVLRPLDVVYPHDAVS